MSDQKHDFTGLVVDDHAIAEAHAARVRSLTMEVGHMQSRARRWPREWTAALACQLFLARADLARSMTDEAIHLHGMEARARALRAGLDWLEAKIDAMPDTTEMERRA